MLTILVRAMIVLLLLGGPAGALAASTVFTGSVGPGGSKMPRLVLLDPDCLDADLTLVSYLAIPFRVTATGSYSLSDPNPDVAISLHTARFDPRNPLSSCLTADSNAPSIAWTLSADVEYVLVVMDYTVAQAGEAFNVSVSGPGNIDRRCAGFTDIDAGSAFCFNVAWLKNRQVTLGCTSTSYCPDGNVTRLQMAAFMNRLGDNLAPLFVHSKESSAEAAMSAGNVICATPRTVLLTARIASLSAVMVYHSAPSAVLLQAQMVYSVDGGTVWQVFGDFFTQATNPPSGYAVQAPVARARRFEAGQQVRFGVRPLSAGTPTDGACELSVRLDGV